MAQVIENLLIGVGLDTDKKSFQNAEGSLDGLKSKALQVGAVLAGAFGVDALTFGFAEKTDELGKFSERWNVAANDVAAYDRALGLAGGTQGEFLGTIRNLSKALTLAPFERAQLLGELSKFGIGDQVSEVLDAGSALDAFLVSADQLQTLQGKQKEKFIEAMGFSESEVRLLSSGRAEILKVVNEQKKMAPVTQKMTDTAAKFNDEWQDLTTNVTGFSNTVAEPLTASIASIIVGMNDWIAVNRDVVTSLLEFGGGMIADNIELITGALLVLGGAKMLMGLNAIGKGLGIISKESILAAKGAGLLKTAMLALAAVEIVKAADEDGPLSASNLFGKNAVTEFLDTPIASHFDSIGNTLTKNAPTTQSSAYGTQPVIKVEVMLDGEPVKAITKQVIMEEGEQVIQDFATSNGG